MGISENASRFSQQVWQGTVGQIRNAPKLAAVWRSRAVSQSETLPKLAQQVTDGAASFISTINRLNAASTDPVKGPLVTAAVKHLTNDTMTVGQVKTTMGNFRTACIVLRDSPKITYADLIVAIDAFTGTIPSIPDDPGEDTIWT